MDDVVVIRPKAAWNDPKNPLNLPTTRFDLKDAHLHEILHARLDLPIGVTRGISSGHALRLGQNWDTR
jgi:hypothetical protein